MGYGGGDMPHGRHGVGVDMFHVLPHTDASTPIALAKHRNARLLIREASDRRLILSRKANKMGRYKGVKAGQGVILYVTRLAD